MDQQDRYPGADAEGSRAGDEFHIGGNVGAFATGQYGQATGNVYGSDAGDPLEMIDRLLRKLEADAGMLEGEQAEDVLDDVQRLHTESTSSTAALLATVEQIKELISTILH